MGHQVEARGMPQLTGIALAQVSLMCLDVGAMVERKSGYTDRDGEFSAWAGLLLAVW